MRSSKKAAVRHWDGMRNRIADVVKGVVQDPEIPEKEAYSTMVSRLLGLFHQELLAQVVKGVGTPSGKPGKLTG